MASPDSFRKDFTHLPILLFQRNEGMAKELDAFYANLRKTGIDRAVTVKRGHPILDFPPSSLSIEWGSGKVELGLTYREAVSNLRAWNEVIELIDGLLKR